MNEVYDTNLLRRAFYNGHKILLSLILLIVDNTFGKTRISRFRDD